MCAAVGVGGQTLAGRPRARRLSGSNRVNRGGSWNNEAQNARAAYRNNWTPDNRNDNLGFRLASPGAGRFQPSRARPVGSRSLRPRHAPDHRLRARPRGLFAGPKMTPAFPDMRTCVTTREGHSLASRLSKAPPPYPCSNLVIFPTFITGMRVNHAGIGGKHVMPAVEPGLYGLTSASGPRACPARGRARWARCEAWGG